MDNLKRIISLVAILLTTVLTLTKGSQAQGFPLPGPSDKTAGQFYKNVQILNDMPADDLNNSMWFIAGALGVPCQHCHVGAFESDTKQAKLTARNMLKMTRGINEANFGGRNVVTCNTCHQGSIRPNGVDSFWGKFNKTPEQIAAYLRERQPAAPTAQAPPPATSPTAVEMPPKEEIYSKYRNAIGTVSVKSMHLTMELQADLAPQPLHVELVGVLPNQFEQTITTAVGQVKQIINGDRGWNVTPAGVTPMTPVQVAGFISSPALWPFTKLNTADAPQTVSGIEKIDDRFYFVLEKLGPKNRSLYYFDTETGLLRRIASEFLTPLGTYPARTDITDYREVGGVKMATTLITFGSSGGSTIKVTDIRVNVPVDPAKFQPPAPTAPSSPR